MLYGVNVQPHPGSMNLELVNGLMQTYGARDNAHLMKQTLDGNNQFCTSNIGTNIQLVLDFCPVYDSIKPTQLKIHVLRC